MINATLKKLNIERNSHKYRNTARIKNEWLSNTFDEGMDRKTLSARWVSSFEEHTN